jgi:chromate transporter
MHIKKNLELYSVFFSIGLVAFGGGLAMLPLLNKSVVEQKKWLTKDELVNYFALTQTIPGIIAANVATMAGYRVNKFWGALFSLLGMITPSIIIISLIAAFLQNFQDNVYVINTLNGINIAVIALLVNLIFTLKKNIIDWITLSIAIVTFIGVALFKINPPYFIVASAIVGLVVYSRRPKL